MVTAWQENSDAKPIFQYFQYPGEPRDRAKQAAPNIVGGNPKKPQQPTGKRLHFTTEESLQYNLLFF